MKYLDIYSKYNDRELKASFKSLTAAMNSAKASKKPGSGNLQTCINVKLRAVKAVLTSRGINF